MTIQIVLIVVENASTVARKATRRQNAQTRELSQETAGSATSRAIRPPNARTSVRWYLEIVKKKAILPKIVKTTAFWIIPQFRTRNRKKLGNISLKPIKFKISTIFAWYVGSESSCHSANFQTQALKIYCKAVPETRWDQLERAFRLHNFNTFLIARVDHLNPPSHHRHC